MELFLGFVLLVVCIGLWRYTAVTRHTWVSYVRQLQHGDTHHWSYRQLIWALEQIHAGNGVPQIPFYMRTALRLLERDFTYDSPEACVYVYSPATKRFARTSLRRFVDLVQTDWPSNPEEQPAWFLELSFPGYTSVLIGGSLHTIRNGQLMIAVWKGESCVIDGDWTWSGDLASLSAYTGCVSPPLGERTSHVPFCGWLTLSGNGVDTVQELQSLLYREASSRNYRVRPPREHRENYSLVELL